MAIPAIVFALIIVHQGGRVFAAGIFALGVVAMGELYTLMGRVRPPALAGFLTLAAMLIAALYGEPRHVIMVLGGLVPGHVLPVARCGRGASTCRGRSRSPTSASSGSGWRWCTRSGCASLPHGDGLLIDVLVATFLGDTAAYFGGRLYGRTPLAPLISPNKTVEGLVAGVVGAHAGVLGRRPLPGLADRAATRS